MSRMATRDMNEFREITTDLNTSLGDHDGALDFLTDGSYKLQIRSNYNQTWAFESNTKLGLPAGATTDPNSTFDAPFMVDLAASKCVYLSSTTLVNSLMSPLIHVPLHPHKRACTHSTNARTHASAHARTRPRMHARVRACTHASAHARTHPRMDGCFGSTTRRVLRNQTGAR